SSARERYKGYSDVCKENGIEEHNIECDYNFQNGLRVVEDILNQFPLVDGIISCNDMVALSAMKVLTQHRISVPEQIQLIGFDDIEWTQMLTPEISSIKQPLDEMAEKAVELIILESKEQEPPQKEYKFPVKLMARQTTKTL
ncbi:MAG: substrate-binding domain-containing protein, partial [Eubacteriales bacterium]|nr:substrate-binding domain-containing protein [Eubacteriales bacterium]